MMAPLPIVLPILFLFGLGVGSFLNVVVFRLPRGKSVIGERSSCMHCKRHLYWHDLIPVISFFLLAGRCRFCGEKISLQYSLVELTAGLLFLLIGWKFNGALADTLFWLALSALFILIAVFDIRWKQIPTMFLWLLGGGAFLYGVAYPLWGAFTGGTLETNGILGVLSNSVFPGILNGGFILFLVLLTKEKGMGFGDVPIALSQGLLLGNPGGLFALFLSFIMGAIVGVSLMLFGKAGMKTEVPFAPFLIGGLLIVQFLL